MGKAGKRMWRTVWKSGESWLTEADIPAVHQLCDMEDDRALVRDAIRDNPDSPLVWRDRVSLRKIEDNMRRMMTDLGLTPQGRKAVNAQAPSTDDDELAEFRRKAAM